MWSGLHNRSTLAGARDGLRFWLNVDNVHILRLVPRVAPECGETELWKSVTMLPLLRVNIVEKQMKYVVTEHFADTFRVRTLQVSRHLLTMLIKSIMWAALCTTANTLAVGHL